MEAIILPFLWAFYWPLFYVRFKGMFLGYGLTYKKLAACFAVAAVTAAANMTFSIYSPASLTSALSGVVVLSAATPVIILAMLDRAEKRRARAKMLVLAAYFHIFWQLLPSFGGYPIVADLAITAALALLVKISGRHKTGAQEAHGSISELWR